MKSIKYGPNAGKTPPSKMHVENFEYNGFYVIHRRGFAKWTIEKFIGWTKDPGVGKFLCSDGKERYIPSCQLTGEYELELPAPPKLEPFKGNGVLFGAPSSSR